MAFTFANSKEFEPYINTTLTKQYQKLYIGFHLSLTFKTSHCVEASQNNIGLVGTIFLTFQVDSSAGFGESTIFTTQINIYRDECIGFNYTGDYSKQLSPIIRHIHDSLIEQFMITYDSDTRQACANYFAETIHEELVAAVFNPNRISIMIEKHGIEILDDM